MLNCGYLHAPAECGHRAAVRTWQRNFPRFIPAKSCGRNVSFHAVAAALDVPRTRIECIAREERPVTAETALQLGKCCKTSAAFPMNIQARVDLVRLMSS